MSDLISRQAAIEAVEEITWYHQNRNNEMVSGANSELHQAWYKADDIYAALNNVPTAEPMTGLYVDGFNDGYEAGKEDAEPSVVSMKLDVDKESLRKAMEEAELTLVAEPRRGKWIKDECGSVICSECKAYRRDSRINHIRFCNACGARMEVSE